MNEKQPLGNPPLTHRSQQVLEAQNKDMNLCLESIIEGIMCLKANIEEDYNTFIQGSEWMFSKFADTDAVNKLVQMTEPTKANHLRTLYLLRKLIEAHKEINEKCKSTCKLNLEKHELKEELERYKETVFS